MSVFLIIKSLLRRKVVTALLLLQLAVTLGLVVNSLLLASAAKELVDQPTGLSLEQILTVWVKPTSKALRLEPALSEVINRQLAAVRQISGVEAAVYANQIPLRQGGSNWNIFEVDRQDETNVDSVPYYNSSEQIFQVLDVRLITGRLLTELDRGALNIVLTEKLAKQLFAEQNPVGKVTNNGTVVGVVSDFYSQRYASHPFYGQIVLGPLHRAEQGYQLIVRVAQGQSEAVRKQLTDVIRNAEPQMDIGTVLRMDENRDDVFRSEIGLATLLAVLSGLMLLVAMISAYSHAHFHALQMQKEVGIKRALGASKARVLLDVLSESWLTTAIGAGFGILVCYGLNISLAKVISIPAVPVWLPLLTLVLLLLCVTLATWYPARIATRISPATATKTL
ncbi:MAG: ABC transporter permease [Gammaproteobacteria bacterium]|nr:ABC transporter permease [Gammaproteobacteria bacterium]MBU2059907.1 ABC transporter permease [Gammaproteobacteria bacterium]MBU2175838.1 ABC transporter permease [Gammaproteobacteria bacterium]MBU2247661.1 ABC transporter permease [Gammaproteobacteria bacterium]MBU2346480.1 ABC transporter permease [Gammaproteobacteria bacterium]